MCDSIVKLLLESYTQSVEALDQSWRSSLFYTSLYNFDVNEAHNPKKDKCGDFVYSFLRRQQRLSQYKSYYSSQDTSKQDVTTQDIDTDKLFQDLTRQDIDTCK